MSHAFAVRVLCAVIGGLTVGATAVCAEAGQTPERAALPQQVRDLIEAQESSLGLVHQFYVELEVRYRPLLNVPAGTPAYHSGSWSLCVQGDLERLRNKDFAVDPKTRKVQRTLFRDTFQDGIHRKVLTGWDPDHPVALAPTEQQGVKAFLEPQPPKPSKNGDCAVVLLLAVSDMIGPLAKRQPLSAFVRSARQVELRPLGAEERGSADLICLRVWQPAADAATRGDYFDVYLDPRAGMMVRKVVNHKENYKWPGEGTFPWAEWVHEVTRFRDVGQGVFFPEESELRVYRSGREQPTAVTRFVTTRLVVNEELPEGALDFRFPENTLVRYPVENGQRRVALWGADNRPVRFLNGTEEIVAADQALHASAAASYRRVLFVILVSLGTLVAGVAWLYVTHRRAREGA